jgi:UDP-glucose 4-epimerase
MKVLITGGTGFIGSHLANKIVKDGHQVYIISRAADDRTNFSQGYFGDENLLDSALPGIDVVIHLAWTTVPSPNLADISQDVQENINGTINLLNKCVAHQIKKIIFISSGGTVYGIPNEIPIKEDHILNPISSYGISKLAVERYLYLYNKLSGLDYLVFRVSNAYGEQQNLIRGQGVLGIWLDNIFSGKDIVIWGDGTVVRDYVYIEDLVNVISLAVDHPFKERIYNLGFGEGFSLNDIILLIKNHITRDFKYTYKKGRDIDVPVNILDIQKLKNEIDYKPTVDLSKGLLNVWNWIINDR